jgi:cytochrome b involved in lipid metabolism
MAPQKQVDPTTVAAASTPISEGQIQVDKVVYDAAALANMHPGGELFVKAFAGRDATEAFLSYHRRQFPHARMQKMQVGSAAPLKEEEADKDYLELCELVDQVLPRFKAFAPWHYYVKVAVILSAAVGLEMYMHIHADYRWYLTGTCVPKTLLPSSHGPG